MEYKRFTDKNEALHYRDSQRDKKLASSIFEYGKGRYMIMSMESSNEKHPEYTHRYLSNKATTVSDDIEDLTKVKELIANPDLYADIEDMTFVAKKLNKERWFNTPSDVIQFFDYLDEKAIAKIKAYCDEALAEYEEQWNNPEG